MAQTSAIDWDVLIVGAGPAGASAAISLAGTGLRILVVEAKKFPRRKVCGGCLNQISTKLVAKLLGAEHALWKTALPLHSFRLIHQSKAFRFDMPGGVAVDRAELDQNLIERAIEQGVYFADATTAKLLAVDHDSTSRAVQLTENTSVREVRAQVVVLACGLGNRGLSYESDLQSVSAAASRVGIEALFDDFPRRDYFGEAIHMVVDRSGYVGLTQVSHNRLHVAAAVDKKALQRHGPSDLVELLLRSAGAPPLENAAEVVWRGTPSLTARAKRLAEHRVFLVGDAAGYIEPFTGEGIRWALETGVGVAPLVIAATQSWNAGLCERWERWYRDHIEPEQKLCLRIAAGLKNSAARWLAHQALRIQPGIAQSIIARLNQERTA